jgi:hypothetical protein
MKPDIHRTLLLALAAMSLAFPLGGCASKEEIAAQRKWESYDQRADREVFRTGWIRPHISEDEKDFFYRPFFKTSNEL